MQKPNQLGSNLNLSNFPITHSMTYYSAIRNAANLNHSPVENHIPPEQLHIVDAQPLAVSGSFPNLHNPGNSVIRSVSQSHVTQYRSKSKINNLEQLQYNTLDEPILESISMEFQSMFEKLSYVIVPRFDGSERQKLKNWDLWGPLFICLAIGLILEDPNQLFILTFITFAGAILITFNSRVLGGKISFLQSISILGYCVFPLFAACLLLWFLKSLNFRWRIITVLFVVMGVIWSILSARTFIICNIPEGKYFLGMYPVCLFYIFIGTFIIYM